jgi:O-antigen/teichoic acid export membrane protein
LTIEDPAIDGAVAAGRLGEAPATLFARLGRNVLWLLGARGISGALSIAYLGIAARALGASGFGTFVLILAYSGSIAGLAQFKSWQAVVRYGALHVAAGRADRLAELIGFTATIDTVSAVLGALIAIVGTHVAAPLFGWTAEQAHIAGLFGAFILLTTGDTASGVLRLSGRFALLAATGTIAAVVRLVGAGIVWSTGGGLSAMLAVWGVAAIVECGLEWTLALATRKVRIAIGRRHWRAAFSDNLQIGRFMIENSVASAIAVLWQQAGTLSVGAVGGPAMAGGYRIASKLATALSQPAETATRALYPELAALIASPDPILLRRVVARTTAIGLCLALLLVAGTALAGPALLRLVSGRAVVAAEPFLVLLAIASAVDLAAVALEPLLNAHGSSREIVRARVAGAVTYAGALALLMTLCGPIGAAVAAIVAAAVLRLWQAVAARRLLDPPQDVAG